jgi:hypothetical protein
VVRGGKEREKKIVQSSFSSTHSDTISFVHTHQHPAMLATTADDEPVPYDMLVPDVISDTYRSEKVREYLKSLEAIVHESVDHYPYHNRVNIPAPHQYTAWMLERASTLRAQTSKLPNSGLGLVYKGKVPLDPGTFVCEYNGFLLTSNELDALDSIKNDFETGIAVPCLDTEQEEGFVLVGHPNTFGPLLNDVCQGKHSCLLPATSTSTPTTHTLTVPLPTSAHTSTIAQRTAGKRKLKRFVPNVEFRLNEHRLHKSQVSRILQPGCVELFTTEKVVPGEELFLNYGTEFWKTYGRSRETVCTLCKSGKYDADTNTILMCDGQGCENAYHLYCLTPQLSSTPEGSWFCPPCVAKLKE